jgi:hypothetical protein
MADELELSQEQTEFYQWLEELEYLPPLAGWEESPETLERPEFALEELDRLEDLGREYAQELFDREAIPDLPPLEPEMSLDHEPDLDRGR